MYDVMVNVVADGTARAAALLNEWRPLLAFLIAVPLVLGVVSAIRSMFGGR